MLQRLTAIDILEHDFTLLASPSVAGETLLAAYQSVRRTQTLFEAEQLVLTLPPGHPALTTYEAGAPGAPAGAPAGTFLRPGRLVRLTYGASVKVLDFRIVESTRHVAEPGGAVDDGAVHGVFISDDLADIYPTRTVGDFIDVTPILSGRSPQDTLDELVSSDSGVPGHFAAGTVSASLVAAFTGSGKALDLTFNGEQSILNGLRRLAKQLGGEVDFEYGGSGSPNTWLVNIVPYVGLSAAEGETPDPSLRTITVGSTVGGNARSLMRSAEGREAVAAIRVLAGSEDERITLADTQWPIASAVFASGETTITIDAASGTDAIWEHSALEGSYFGFAASWFLITATTAPGAIVVAGDASGLMSGNPAVGRFAVDNAGTPLIDLPVLAEAPARPGVKVVVAQDVIAYDNLLSGIVSADLSTHVGGPPALPVGIETITGDETLTLTTDRLSVAHGSHSLIVQCDAGAGIRTAPIDLSPTLERPWHSTLAHIRVPSGRVRFELEDSTGRRFPLSGEDSYSAQSLLRAIKVEGYEPAAGDARLRLVALEDGTEFHVDALTLTRSSEAQDYSPTMGLRGLWAKGVEAVQDERRGDMFQGQVFDAAALDAGSEPIACGSFVRLTVPTGGTPAGTRQVDARVETIDVLEDRVNGAFAPTFTLQRRDRLADLFVETDKRLKLPPFTGFGEAVKPGLQRARSTKEDAGVRYGTAILSPSDPGNLIAGVYYRLAAGANIDDASAWQGPLAATAEGTYEGTYAIDVALDPDRTSAIELEVRYKSPFDTQADRFAWVFAYDIHPRIVLSDLRYSLRSGSDTYDVYATVQRLTQDAQSVAWTYTGSGGLAGTVDFGAGDSETFMINAGAPLSASAGAGATETLALTGYSEPAGAGIAGGTISQDVSVNFGSLDDIPNGATYGKLFQAALTGGGYVALSQTVGSVDDIDDGLAYKRTQAAALSPSGLVLLDETIEGSYGRVLASALQAGRLLLSQAVGTLDDIGDGLTYSRVASAALSPTGLVLLDQAEGTLDDIGEGVTYGRVLQSSLSAGRLLFSETVGDWTREVELTGSGVFRMGASGYLAGTGVYMDASGGTPRMHIGNPASQYMAWSGSGLAVRGAVTIESGSSGIGNLSDAGGLATANMLGDVPDGGGFGKTTTNQVTGAARAFDALDSSGNLVTGVRGGWAAPVSGSGLYLGSDYLGYYSGSAWQTYMDSAGRFYLGGASGKLRWDGSSLYIDGSGTFSGDLSAATGTFAGALSAASGTFAGALAAASGSFAGDLTGGSMQLSGDLDVTGALTAGAATLDSLGIDIADGSGFGNELSFGGASGATRMFVRREIGGLGRLRNQSGGVVIDANQGLTLRANYFGTNAGDVLIDGDEINLEATTRITGDLFVNSQAVWHAGNDGAGSGLDADYLDSYQGTQYARYSGLLVGTSPMTHTISLWINGTLYYLNAATSI